MRELNPNHRVTSTLHDQWHALLAVLLHKFRHDLPSEVVITEADVTAFGAAYTGGAVVAHDKRDGLHLRLVNAAEGERLAREEGGLPA